MVWRQLEPAWSLLRQCRLCLLLGNFDSLGGHGWSIPAREHLNFCLQWNILWGKFLLPCPMVRGQCRVRVATPGVERTNAKQRITSLILNCYNSYFKIPGNMLYMSSIVVKDIRDRTLFFAGTEKNFETFLSAQAENLSKNFFWKKSFSSTYQGKKRELLEGENFPSPLPLQHIRIMVFL